MEKYRLNIDKIKDGHIKTMWHAGWLFADKKNAEIILEVEQQSKTSVIMRLEYLIIGNGIINSDENKPHQEFDIDPALLRNYEDMARELTKLTGLRFSVEVLGKTPIES